MKTQTAAPPIRDMFLPFPAEPPPTSDANTNAHVVTTAPNVLPLDQVLPEDCITGISKLPQASVDIVIADPPYNLSKGGEWKWDSSRKLPGFGGDWQKVMQAWDNMPLEQYFAFTLAWLSELKRVVRPSGSIWIHGTYHNIGIINVALQLLNIEIINEVVWYKRNSFPNLSGRRLTASHETILWAHTGTPKKRQYLFNYATAKSSDFPEDQLKEQGKQMRTVWDVPNNKDRSEIAHGKHPTQKPVRLLVRMLRLSSKPGQTCLVPFAGAGSECVAAIRCGLHFIAFETDRQYAKIAEDRIANEKGLFSAKTAGREAETSGSAPLTEGDTKAPATAVIPPVIKWTGSKRGQACRIRELMPPFNRYFEPFLGGGALLYLVSPQQALVGDIYQPLIDFWRLIKDRPEVIVSAYTREWDALQKALPAHFYVVRDRFNKQPNPCDLSFLTRTCVNGIIRFNDDGEFNNSFHLSRRGMEPQRFAQIVALWSPRLKNVEFRCCDYADIVAEATAEDFIYFDPPYFGSHNRYTANLDPKRFFDVLEALNSRGVRWALSFDGTRGDTDLRADIPADIYKRHTLLSAGHSRVKRVLSGDLQHVQESLYLNY